MSCSPRAPHRRGRPSGLAQDALGATGLLVMMAAIYLIARGLDHHHPVFGFIRAFAERRWSAASPTGSR